MLLLHSCRIPFTPVRKREGGKKTEKKTQACWLFVRKADMTWAGMLITPLPWHQLHCPCFLLLIISMMACLLRVQLDQSVSKTDSLDSFIGNLAVSDEHGGVCRDENYGFG